MTRQVPVLKCKSDQRRQEIDVVAEEEPLAIEVNKTALTLTMRTPGDDQNLATGLLFTEGIIRRSQDVTCFEFGLDDQQNTDTGRLLITLRDAKAMLPQTGWERRFPSTSSCGVCGKTDSQSLQCLATPLPHMMPNLSAETLYSFSNTMRNAQVKFNTTGGLHAAALFDCSGNLLVLKEDIGRHNAVDKVIGDCVRNGLMPLSDRVLMTSGRASFEIVQKAAVAGIPILCSVSAPSSYAVRLAHDMNMTLIGFLRGETMNIYTCPGRVI